MIATGAEKVASCQPLAVSAMKVVEASSVPLALHRFARCVPLFAALL